MCKTEQEHRDEIVQVCRRVYEKGWVASNDGNLSVRLGPDCILCTPTAASKGALDPCDLVICDLSGRRLSGNREPTSEIAMHTIIYSMRPDIGGVVHAHPPTATAFAVAGRALDKALLPEVIVQLGAVPLAPYGTPGTPALTEGMIPLIPSYDAFLLENHGCTTCGSDIWQAFYRMETVEHFARIAFIAELLGGARPLPREEVLKLFAARGRYNVNATNELTPGMPLVAEDLFQEFK